MNSDRKLELALRRRDGEALHIAPWSPLRLVREKGLSSLSYRLLRSDRMTEEGADTEGIVLGGREITLICTVSSAHADQGWRDRLTAFLLPGMEGTLYVDRGRETGDRRIDFVLAGADLDQESLFGSLRVTLTLFCPEPWFCGREVRLPLTEAQPLLTLPFTSIRGGGITSGYGEEKRFYHMENPGELPVGIKVVLRSVGGGMKDPFLICGGGRLSVQAEAGEGDVITVCTEPGRREVSLNGEAVPFARDSSFPKLDPGPNLVTVSHSGDGTLCGEITLTPHYAGA